MTAPKHTPAFPVADPFALEPANAMEMKRIASGMTLRDYFAAKAMQGVVSGSMASGCEMNNGDPEEISRVAYLLADAMFRAREA